MRLFLAIPLPAELRRTLGAWPRAGAGLRWTPAEQLHVTLVFLGETPADRLDDVCALNSAVSAGVSAFELRLGPAGCFPHERAPRVLWLGVDDPAAGCARWVAAARPRLTDLGFTPDERPYTPHVTLARSATPPGAARMRAWLAAAPRPPAQPFRVTEISLYESTLGPGGAQHRVVHAAQLA